MRNLVNDDDEMLVNLLEAVRHDLHVGSHVRWIRLLVRRSHVQHRYAAGVPVCEGLFKSELGYLYHPLSLRAELRLKCTGADAARYLHLCGVRRPSSATCPSTRAVAPSARRARLLLLTREEV